MDDEAIHSEKAKGRIAIHIRERILSRLTTADHAAAFMIKTPSMTSLIDFS